MHHGLEGMDAKNKRLAGSKEADNEWEIESGKNKTKTSSPFPQ